MKKPKKKPKHIDSTPVTASKKAVKADVKPDLMAEPPTTVMVSKESDQSGLDGEALEPRHGFAQKAMKADVTKVLSTGKGRACKAVRALNAEAQAMLDDTKTRQPANAEDASCGAPVAEAQAMLEDIKTRELAVAEASVMLQRAMASQDIQTMRSALVAADVAGVDNQLLAEARDRSETLEAATVHLRPLRCTLEVATQTDLTEEPSTPDMACGKAMKAGVMEEPSDRTGDNMYTIAGKQFPTPTAMRDFINRIGSLTGESTRDCTVRLVMQDQEADNAMEGVSTPVRALYNEYRRSS